MQFIQGNEQYAAGLLAKRLLQELIAGKRVLWLVCGGSNISISSAAWQEVRNRAVKGELEKLVIALTDERYGPVGHKDSNWKQLADAGIDFTLAKPLPVLRGLSLEDTVDAYEKDLENAIDKADIIIAQFGIGADGHIAGALPGSSAIASEGLVDAYEAPNFTRITLTPHGMRQIDAAYAFVFGESKRKAIEDLRNKDLSLSEEPAQILKEIDEAYLVTEF